MSQILALRQAVVDRIKLLLPTFDVQGHLGRFTADELNRFLVAAPAVRVAVLGLAESQDAADEDEIDTIVRLGVYVVTKDGALKGSRDEAACAAVEKIVLAAVGQRWGLAFARAARPATAQNLYNQDTLAKGAALWAVDLPQPVRLSRPEGPVEAPLSELYIGLAPEIGAAHVDDYIGPIPGEATDD